MVASLFLNFGTDYAKALLMRRSDIKTIFDSKAFSDWMKTQDSRQKMDMAVIDRLDALIKLTGQLGKVMGKSRP